MRLLAVLLTVGCCLTGLAADVAPSISTQPVALTVPAGCPFAVTATGTAPLAYQWHLAGDVMAGATTSRYTWTTEYQTAEPAEYFVVVTNAAGAVPSARTYHFAATATGTNGLESDYSKEAVLTVSNRIQFVTCAWDAPESNAIAYYTLYQGTAAGCYTNSVTTTNTQATIRISPAVPSNLVVTVTSTGCTNLQYRQAVGTSWTGWASLGRTNLEATNPIFTAREWRGVGRPSATKRVYISRRFQ